MNYEKIIIELLGRIQVLEEQVAMLIAEKKISPKKETSKVTTNDIRNYIMDLKQTAKERGQKSIVLKSGDIHKALELKSALPQVCNAMRQCMEDFDTIVHTTPSGNSSTIVIKYELL